MATRKFKIMYMSHVMFLLDDSALEGGEAEEMNK